MTVLLMPAGMSFVVIGAWMPRWTYRSVVYGFVKGCWVFLFSLKVTSKKLMVCLLASMVIRSSL